MGHAQDYPYIRAWGRLMHSNRDYVLDQQALARVERAPKTAIFRRDDGWRTWEGITDGPVKEMIATVVAMEARGE